MSWKHLSYLFYVRAWEYPNQMDGFEVGFKFKMKQHEPTDKCYRKSDKILY